MRPWWDDMDGEDIAYGERFTASSFASDPVTAGDVTAGEDPVVRRRRLRRWAI